MRLLLAFVAVLTASTTSSVADVVYAKDPLVMAGSGFHSVIRQGNFRPDAGDPCVAYIEYATSEAAEVFNWEGESFTKIELVDGDTHLGWYTLEEIDALAQQECQRQTSTLIIN